MADRRPERRRERQNQRVSMLYNFKEHGRFSSTYLINLLIILMLGLVMLFSASYSTGYYRFGDSLHFIRPQFLYALLGCAVMYAVSWIDYRWLRQWTWTLYLLCLVLLVVVLFMDPINGCRRWINLEHLPTLQPSEICKFSLVLTVAHLMDLNRRRIKTLLYGAIIPGCMILPFWALLYLEPHYSAMILMACILGTMLLCGGTAFRWFGIGAAGVGVLGSIFLLTRMGYIQERLDSWLNPDNILYQTRQSLYSIGSGGLMGQGIGKSLQKHLWLPEATNDFIFAVICEEMGFIGALVCILLFAALIFQGFFIAINAADRFGCLLCVGITAQIAWQVLFNIAVVTDTVPNTGISLPFFSSGGTSLVMLMAEIGVVLSVSREGNRVHEMEKKEEINRLLAQKRDNI